MSSFQVRYYSHFYAHDEHGLPVLFRYETVNPHTLHVACFELSDTNFSYRRLSLSLLSLVSLFDNFFVLITGISSDTRLSIHSRHTPHREET